METFEGDWEREEKRSTSHMYVSDNNTLIINF